MKITITNFTQLDNPSKMKYFIIIPIINVVIVTTPSHLNIIVANFSCKYSIFSLTFNRSCFTVEVCFLKSVAKVSVHGYVRA